MNDIVKRRLEEAGVDWKTALARFVNNEALLEKFLNKFIEDESFHFLKAALEKENVKDAFIAAHTLKGVCGNLSMMRLQQAVSRQVEYLREGNLTDAVKCMDEVEKTYWLAVNAIKRWDR